MSTELPTVQVLTAGGAGTTKAPSFSSKSNGSSRRGINKKKVSAAPTQAQNEATTEDEQLMTLEYEDESSSSSPQSSEHMNESSEIEIKQSKLASFPSPAYSDKIGAIGPDPLDPHSDTEPEKGKQMDLVWLLICFLGIMASFVCYGLLLEFTTSGGRKLDELSFLFVTSGLYTLTAAAGRYVRDETPTTIPPARFAILAITSMGSTYCSVRSLRYVIYPIQVLAKSCKPVPVMIMGALMGKRYPLRKYINVVMIVMGVALFMGGGDNKKKGGGTTNDDEKSGAVQLIGILLLFISLCFDGGTGAYEDKLMSVHSVQPFDLMYNIQLGKTILAGIGLLVFNQMHIFINMVQEMGFLLVALGLSGALGQVFIFVTIAKFGALTCSIIGLARKVTTLVASIYFYGHHLNSIQFIGLLISVTAMVMNFWGKKTGGGGHGHGGHGEPKQNQPDAVRPEELQKMLNEEEEDEEEGGDVEMPTQKFALPPQKS